jgi:hypothetical protein
MLEPSILSISTVIKLLIKPSNISLESIDTVLPSLLVLLLDTCSLQLLRNQYQFYDNCFHLAQISNRPSGLLLLLIRDTGSLHKGGIRVDGLSSIQVKCCNIRLRTSYYIDIYKQHLMDYLLYILFKFCLGHASNLFMERKSPVKTRSYQLLLSLNRLIPTRLYNTGLIIQTDIGNIIYGICQSSLAPQSSIIFSN